MSTIQKLDVTVPIFISNETPILFPIYADQSEKEYLKCDICGRELRLENRKNTQGFLSHRGSKGCKKGKQNLLQLRLTLTEGENEHARTPLAQMHRQFQVPGCLRPPKEYISRSNVYYFKDYRICNYFIKYY